MYEKSFGATGGDTSACSEADIKACDTEGGQVYDTPAKHQKNP